MKTRVRKAFWLQMLPLLAGFAVLAAIIGARAWLIEGQRRDQEAMISASQFERNLTEVLSLLQDAETGQRGFLLTGDEAYLEPLSTAREKLPAAMDAIRSRVAADRQQTIRFTTLDELVGAKLNEIDAAIGLYRSERSTDAIALVRSGEGKRLMDALRVNIDAMRRTETEVIAARLKSSTSASRWLSVGSLAALVALAFVAAISIAGSRRRMLEIVAAHDQLEAAN
jgi:CHASE3 domain sensor protein